MTFGFQPMAFRLDVYSGGQPPRMWNRAAMPDNVSPYWTTYVVAGLVAGTDGTATLRVRGRITSLLLAVVVFGWAGSADTFMPTATRVIDKIPQASTTHADFVHVRIVLSLSFRGDQ